MPYVRAKKYVRKSTKPKSTFNAKVRKVITKAAQLKHVANEVSVSPFTAATIYTHCPTQNIAPGTGISARLGDQVKLHKLILNGYVFAAQLSNANAKFRVSVIYSTQGKAASSVTSGGFNYADLFLPNTYTVNGICGVFDEKAVTVLSDQIIDINSFVSTATDIKSWTQEIYLKDVKCEYIDSGSAFAKKKNLYIIFQAYSAAGANPTNCGSFFYSYDLQFKDI